jgi:hypothetical protein
MYLAAILLSLCLLQAPPEPPASNPPAEPAKGAPGSDEPAAGAQPSTPVDEKLDAILTRLEHRGEGLKDIACKVVYVEEDQINLSQQKKSGTIRFLLTEANPIFMIEFDKTVVDGLLGKREWYYFDGRWLWRALERTKTVSKQELVPEGEVIDLFNIESAPFILPFGHKKAEILRNFDVRLAPPAEGDPKDADHVVCTPKPGSRLADRYQHVQLFVDRELGLPVRIVTTKGGGYIKETADFPDLSPKSLNAGLTARHFAPLKEWREYEMSEEPLK